MVEPFYPGSYRLPPSPLPFFSTCNFVVRTMMLTGRKKLTDTSRRLSSHHLGPLLLPVAPWNPHVPPDTRSTSRFLCSNLPLPVNTPLPPSPPPPPLPIPPSSYPSSYYFPPSSYFPPSCLPPTSPSLLPLPSQQISGFISRVLCSYRPEKLFEISFIVHKQKKRFPYCTVLTELCALQCLYLAIATLFHLFLSLIIYYFKHFSVIFRIPSGRQVLVYYVNHGFVGLEIQTNQVCCCCFCVCEVLFFFLQHFPIVFISFYFAVLRQSWSIFNTSPFIFRVLSW